MAYVVEENRTLRAQLQTPYRAPNANARAERFVRSITTECLVKVIPFGERHFRRTLTDFVAHDHGERSIKGWATPSSTARHGRNTRDGVAVVGGSVACSTTTIVPHNAWAFAFTLLG